MMAKTVALLFILASGCERSYWVASADLRDARAATQQAVPADRIALKSDRVYLRYSLLRSTGANGDRVEVRAQNKRAKRIAGAVLLGLGAALTAGGIALVGYGASLRSRDSVGAGIVAGLGALPLGVGIGVTISGGVLLGRSRGPSDLVPPGDPTLIYFPPQAVAP